MFRPFPLRKRKSPELLEREAVGGFGTCCFRMPLLFKCYFYPSRGRLKPIRQVGRCSIRLPLNHYRRGLSFPPLFLPAERFLTPSSARIREDAKAHRHESPFSPLYRLPFCECEKRSAERSGVQRRSLWQDTTPVVRQVSSCKEKPSSEHEMTKRIPFDALVLSVFFWGRNLSSKGTFIFQTQYWRSFGKA